MTPSTTTRFSGLRAALRSSNPAMRARDANLFTNDSCAALKSCHGTSEDDWEVRSHEDITVADLELLKRFDFDFRSESPKPGGSTLRSRV